MELWHEILHRIPVVNSIYSSVKQIPTPLLLERTGVSQGPARAVAAGRHVDHRLPDRRSRGGVADHLPPDCVAVYVPTTPNPTGGYFVIVARKNVIEPDMSVDQALKYIISMGVVPPQ